ncbi:hypothetical protein HDV57DRAFT_505050 [Trichoderma longibrachiatum]
MVGVASSLFFIASIAYTGFFKAAVNKGRTPPWPSRFIQAPLPCLGQSTHPIHSVPGTCLACLSCLSLVDAALSHSLVCKIQLLSRVCLFVSCLSLRLPLQLP